MNNSIKKSDANLLTKLLIYQYATTLWRMELCVQLIVLPIPAQFIGKRQLRHIYNLNTTGLQRLIYPTINHIFRHGVSLVKY